jgi:regulator of replication initiation timing
LKNQKPNQTKQTKNKQKTKQKKPQQQQQKTKQNKQHLSDLFHEDSVYCSLAFISSSVLNAEL